MNHCNIACENWYGRIYEQLHKYRVLNRTNILTIWTSEAIITIR